jgi:hypothetical protein
MADIYKAIFTCPKYEEREVWYVSSRKHAELMLRRHISTPRTKKKAVRYEEAEYSMTVEPVFTSDGDAGYDPRGVG